MSNNLKIVFFGTPDFAVASLKQITKSNHEVVAVCTVADKPAGRGKKLRQSAVKVFGDENNIDVLQPSNLKAPEFLSELESYKADLFIVVAFRKLPKAVWAMSQYGTFNLHASLLPNYRGAAPINWAIINGDTQTGVTTFFINEEIDAGEVLFNESVEIGKNDNVGDLHDKLMEVGGKLVVSTINSIAEGTATPFKQLLSDQIKSAPKIFKPDCAIDWKESADKLYNKVRGLSPYPAAHSQLISPEKEVYPIKIFGTELVSNDSNGSFGDVITDGKTFLKVTTGNDILQITDIQLSGKKRMKILPFLAGFKIDNDWKLKSKSE
ncbi:MAG: methionyl-tRNA formyltransferase [Flavobacteriales bacterium]|nr:methionyl-tRNA formyltransferase [Flavobacteriales bacterium]